MRLYEATGVGTLLITDAKVNLRDMFEPDQEVVIYRDAQECVAKLRYYLSHPDDAVAIAAAGQRRTIREHTYADRMRQLTQILSNTA
jgi:spore maturation protein CgeB